MGNPVAIQPVITNPLWGESVGRFSLLEINILSLVFDMAFTEPMHYDNLNTFFKLDSYKYIRNLYISSAGTISAWSNDEKCKYIMIPGNDSVHKQLELQITGLELRGWRDQFSSLDLKILKSFEISYFRKPS